MTRTVEAVIDEDGNVKLLEPVHLSSTRRALVTILEEEAVAETALLSEAALAEDWDRPEEDQAWAHPPSARQQVVHCKRILDGRHSQPDAEVRRRAAL